MLAHVADTSKQVRFSVAAVGVCEVVVCTFCAFDALSAGRLGLEPVTDGKANKAC